MIVRKCKKLWILVRGLQLHLCHSKVFFIIFICWGFVHLVPWCRSLWWYGSNCNSVRVVNLPTAVRFQSIILMLSCLHHGMWTRHLIAHSTSSLESSVSRQVACLFVLFTNIINYSIYKIFALTLWFETLASRIQQLTSMKPLSAHVWLFQY